MATEQEALSKLRQLISGEQFQEGDKLPPERQLAEEYGISRRTLRNAFAILEAEGEIWRGVGQGTFIGRKTPRRIQDLADLGRSVQPLDIAEARAALEPVIARFAALRASSDDIQEMHRCASKGAAASDLDTHVLWDNRFHKAVAEAAHNQALQVTFDVLVGLWGQMKLGHSLEQAFGGEWHRIFSRQHRGIIEAIELRDADWTENLMLEHLQAFRSVVLPDPVAEARGRGGAKPG